VSDEVEAALDRLADLVQEVPIERVECPKNAEITRQRDLASFARRCRYGQPGVVAAAERRQQAAERGVNRRAGTLVDHQPGAAIARLVIGAVVAAGWSVRQGRQRRPPSVPS